MNLHQFRHLSASQLPVQAQTLFSQIVDSMLSHEHQRTVAHLPGNFVKKSVKGYDYWYFQYTDQGKQKQIFVGPNTNEAVRHLVEQKKQKSDDDKQLKNLAAASLKMGCSGVTVSHFKILKRLSDHGLFRAGGTLIGTHAFLLYSNMLGVKWPEATPMQTNDIDFAHAGNNVSLAVVNDIDIHLVDAIKSLEMGFFPVKTLNNKDSGTYQHPEDKDFRLDFLTPLTRDREPYFSEDLHVALQPLPFMEFSLEDVQQTVLLSPSGPLLVNIPNPSRFAVHKLIVCHERESGFQHKTNKDLAQAGLLISVLKDQRPHELKQVWDDAISRGAAWKKNALSGLEALHKKMPELDLLSFFDVPQKEKATKRYRIFASENGLSFIKAQKIDIHPHATEPACFVARLTEKQYETLSFLPSNFVKIEPLRNSIEPLVIDLTTDSPSL